MKKSKKLGPSPKIFVSTFNLRTLSTEAHFLEFENAISKIKYDIIGLCEIKRTGQNTITRNGNIFHYYGKNNKRGSVGFFIKAKWSNNIKLFKDFSDRVTVVVLKVNEKETLAIVQVYAPTSTADDKEMDAFYDDLQKAQTEFSTCTWQITIGDMNSKIGLRNVGEEDFMGQHGYGMRNERGDRMIRFARSNELYIANTIFKKRTAKRWTWKSPDGKTKNEIDFVLVKKTQKAAVKNVEVLNNFHFQSDHRMVRMSFEMKIKRKFYHTGKKITVNGTKTKEFNNALMKNLVEVKNDTLKEAYENFEKAILKSAECFRKPKTSQSVLSDETKKEIARREELLKLRHTNLIANEEFIEQRKKVFKMIREDERKYMTDEVETAIVQGSSLKRVKSGTFSSKSWIQKLRNENGNLRYERGEVNEIATKFYENLYHTKMTLEDRKTIEPCLLNIDEVDEISVGELLFAIKSMKNNKAPGSDELPVDLLKVCSENGLENLTKIFNLILRTEEIPEKWCESNIILIHKNGDKSDITNYRPISLISHLCKLFMKIVMFRIGKQLDSHQPPEQAGFRSNFSTTDHVFTLNQLVEKCNEFNKTIFFAFIDYQKAFDTLEHPYIWKALKTQGIEEKYIRIIRKVYENATARVKLEKCGRSFKITKGVRQGDPLSPKLFIAVLQAVFSSLNWTNKGLNVNGKKLSNLRFADDLTLISESKQELVEMIEELKIESEKVGLFMNWKKTKIMTNDGTSTFAVDGRNVEKVEKFKFLGTMLSFKDREQIEISARISSGWKAFWSYKRYFTDKNLARVHKRRLIDMCILPVFTYGAASWTFSDHSAHRLQVEQRAMERIMLGVNRYHRLTNEKVRKKTQVKDVAATAMELKWRWAGHLARQDEDRISKQIEKWEPNNKRSKGRPVKRWKDDVAEVGGIMWRRNAKNRENWKKKEISFIQQWIVTGNK
jgi:Reverse transcriptase (RNA-dependent DNA polymerase)